MARIDWVVGDTIGYGIGGFETATDGDNPLFSTGSTTFTGKGAGAYSYNTNGGGMVSTPISFNIEADVNFGTRVVMLESSGTCTSSAGCNASAEKRNHLNFKGDATYTAGTNALNFADVITQGSDNSFTIIGDSELTGTASARFYGGLTNELGGTFSLSSLNGGYVGWFGTERGYVTTATITTATLAEIVTDNTDPENLVTETVPTTLNSNTLANFTDSAKTGTLDNALSANFVQITRNSVDKSINNDIFTNGVVVFDYAGGNFAGSGKPLSIYLGDRKYWTEGAVTTDEELNANKTAYTLGSSDNIAPAYLSLSRNSFGDTAANYMARVRWVLTDDTDITDSTDDSTKVTVGYGITGFATVAPLAAGTTIFTGAGVGRYSDSFGNISTNFNINANVDFGNRTVSLASTGTCTGVSCGTARADLNFTASVDYGTTDMAKFTGNDLAFDNVETTSGLTGDATAKFYGPESNEFGGTFNLTSDNAAYVGFFGGEIGYIVNETTTTTDSDNDGMVAGDNLPTDFTLPFTSFNDDVRKNKTATFEIDNLVSITHDGINKTVTSDIISGGVVKYKYNNTTNAPIDPTSLTAYFDETKYKAASGLYNAGVGGASVGGEVSLAYTTNSNQIDSPYTFIFSRDTSSFGVVPNYLALIEWSVASVADGMGNKTYEIGYGIFGFTTDGDDILKGYQNISFTGAGKGRYSAGSLDASNTGVVLYYFDINANVDFSARTVTLSSTKTCLRENHCTATSRPDLDFTGTLTYADGDNDLSTNNTGGEALTTKGGAYAAYTDTDGTGTDFSYDAGSTTSLTGDANAKFYGTGAVELGGTFSFANGGIGYTGYFGAQRDGWLVTTQVKATQATYDDVGDGMTYNVPTTFADIADYTDGFADEERKNNIANNPLTLRTSNAVRTNKDTTAETINNYHYTSGVAEITYSSLGNITSVSTYIGDRKHTVTATNADDTYFQGSGTNFFSSDGVDPIEFNFNRTPSINYGFTAQYMATLFWGIDTYDKGYVITGFETAAIPTDAGEVTFTGKGRGRYNTTASTHHERYFKVTATVDFSQPAKGITFNTTETCSSSNVNPCGDSANKHLNMTGTLNYSTNEINGTVKTAGTDLDFDTVDADGTELSGTANARFYGPASEELGGTFSVSGETSSFVGFFGADNPNN